MVNDLRDKGSDCDENTSKTCEKVVSDETPNEGAKTCADCGTTKTPLWRGGPAGPKSLCNACGIRSRKRKRALLGLSNKEEKNPRKMNSNTSTITTSDGSSSNNVEHVNNKMEDVDNKMADSPKRKPLSENVLQRPRSSMSKKRRAFGEEERRAAMLLMSLSCGSVFAY
ncbi:GATA transcription factor [Heracleum sosnowskyi]|uniref:GATA transcription factor n=1 Tax=Heracleum sosnowskyi TaxID=360622 RepID=A0AAD8IL56_9APIA|nr:GATA transcription factor [Heracleum sosnowskyi]